MNRLATAAAALVFSLSTSAPYQAMAASDTVEGVMTICTDVINLQYADDRSRDTQCITAVSEFLGAIGAPSIAADPQIADLVLKLVELYREDSKCKIADTELPDAIETAAQKVLDEEIKAEYVLIYEQIRTCDFSPTSAINPVSASASES